MRRGGDRLLAGLILAAAAVASASAQLPGTQEEDVAAAAAELDALDQPPTAAELAALLEGTQQAEDGGLQGEAELRWNRDAEGRTGRDVRLRAAWEPVAARVRLRRSAAGEAHFSFAATARGGDGGVCAGGWTWQQGFGLALGAAGRSAALSADARLQPGSSGPRAWTGSADPHAAQGGAVRVSAGGWAFGTAWGRSAEAGALALASIGRATGVWDLVVVSDRGAPSALGATGRWNAGAWSGAWEVVANAGARGSPGGAGSVAWRNGRRWEAEALAVSVPAASLGPAAGAQPLLGAAPGSLAALRLRHRFAPGRSAAALVATADHEEPGGDGRERRLVTDFLAEAALPGGAVADVRLRTSARTVRTWSEAWPWAAPVDGPGRRTQALTLGVGRMQGGSGWRVRLRSLTVDHSPTAGRRSLLALELGERLGRGLAWRAAWRLAWGAPVDLADAVSPMPGLVVPRHWGRWNDGLFLRLDWALGPCRLHAAADLRNGSEGAAAREYWAGAAAAW